VKDEDDSFPEENVPAEPDFAIDWDRVDPDKIKFIPSDLTKEEREFYGESMYDKSVREHGELVKRAKEAKKQRQKREEEERRNPTPLVQPADFPIDLPYKIRDQHIYIPGGTRRGKTTQMLRIIMEDIANGFGVGVIDPKGGLVSKICALMPEERIKDCIYLDLDSTPIPLDFMGHEKLPKSERSSGNWFISSPRVMRIFRLRSHF
jgi:hypothetical protein